MSIKKKKLQQLTSYGIGEQAKRSMGKKQSPETDIHMYDYLINNNGGSRGERVLNKWCQAHWIIMLKTYQLDDYISSLVK